MGAPNSPGPGFNFGTQSDWISSINGVTRETHKANTILNFGADFEFTVGGKTKKVYVGDASIKWDGVQVLLHAGAVSDNFIGIKHSGYASVNIDTFKAKKLEFSHGSSYKRFYSVQDEVNYAKYNKRTVGPVTVDSDACYTILGGAGDASQLILDSGTSKAKYFTST
jgi:hypothetical protein